MENSATRALDRSDVRHIYSTTVLTVLQVAATCTRGTVSLPKPSRAVLPPPGFSCRVVGSREPAAASHSAHDADAAATPQHPGGAAAACPGARRLRWPGNATGHPLQSEREAGGELPQRRRPPSAALPTLRRKDLLLPSSAAPRAADDPMQPQGDPARDMP